MDEQEKTTQQAPHPPVLCRKCGSSISAKSKFCPRCGEKTCKKSEATKRSKEERAATAKAAASTAIGKIKAAKKKQKAVLAVVVLMVLVAIVSLISTPPYIGKWYSTDSSDAVFEIKRGGTATILSNPEASATWEKLENGDIEMTILDLSSGRSYRSSVVLEYGKTNTGIKYLDDGDDLYFKSYDDAKKIKESKETSSSSMSSASSSSSSSTKKSYS